jgi:hypothetical protein
MLILLTSPLVDCQRRVTSGGLERYIPRQRVGAGSQRTARLVPAEFRRGNKMSAAEGTGFRPRAAPFLIANLDRISVILHAHQRFGLRAAGAQESTSHEAFQ